MNIFLVYFSIVLQIIAINGDLLATPQSLTTDAFSKAKHTLKRKIPQQSTLRPDSCSFFVDVNIFGHNSEIINQIPVSLSLYTSKSFIISLESEGCSDSFIPSYNCSQQNGCSQSEVSKTFQYPYFQLEGNLTHLNTSLSNRFNESSEIEVLYTQTCRKNWSQTTPQQIAGSIGFGIKDKQGFLNSESFSIYTYPEGHQAELILGLDPSKIANYSNIRLFYSNSNWEIPMQSVVTFSLGSDNYSGAIAFEDKLIFDVNSCYLSFPKYLFEHILSQFAEYNLNCTNLSGDKTLPMTCTYSGDPKSLPDIVIADVVIENEIRIEPNIYLSKRKDDVFDLMIVQSVQRIGEEFASSLKYSSYIILGLPFLKEHYIYFSRGGMNRVVIYHSKSSEEDDFKSLHDENTNNSYIGFIIVGVLAGLTLGALIFSCLAQKCNKRNEETHETGLEILGEDDHKEDFLIDLNQRLNSGRVIKPSRFAQLSK